MAWMILGHPTFTGGAADPVRVEHGGRDWKVFSFGG
jgi:hypothetical protein